MDLGRRLVLLGLAVLAFGSGRSWAYGAGRKSSKSDCAGAANSASFSGNLARVGAGIQVATPTSVPLMFEIGAGIQLSAVEIRAAVADAQVCLNRAVASAGAPDLRVSLDMKSVREMTAAAEKEVRGELYEPALRDDGSVLPGQELGFQAHTQKFVISNRVTRSHVKPFYDDTLPLADRQLEVREAALRKKSEQFYISEIEPYFRAGKMNESRAVALRAQHDEMQRELAEIQRQPRSRFGVSSNIYLATREKEASLLTRKELAETIAHELLHSWGGLADRYSDPDIEQRLKYQGNVMGAPYGCSMTAEQADAIRRFRADGEEEFLPGDDRR